MEVPEQLRPVEQGISVEAWSDSGVVEVLWWQEFDHDD